jgi:hypothetical protein
MSSIDSLAASALHHLRAHAGKALGPTEVVIDDAGRRVGIGDHHAVLGAGGNAQLLGGVVVKRQRHLAAIRQVGRDVARGELQLAVLDVLGMNEQDVVDDPQLLEQGGTDETVEVTPGDEAVRAIE